MKNEINENKALSQTSVSGGFFDINYWNNSNALYKVVQHHIENMVRIEYIGTSKMRICVCVDKKDIRYGIDKFWIEFERQSQNNALENLR